MKNKNADIISKMNEEYEKGLKQDVVLNKPPMPTYNLSAYNEVEYLSVVEDLNRNFDQLDDIQLTIDFLKGE